VAGTEELHPQQRARTDSKPAPSPPPCTPTKESAIADLEAATGCGFVTLKDADPLKKTEAEREAIKAGIPVIVPIEDTADLML
jgi:hypothetical protein